MSMEFDTVLGPEYYSSVPDRPNERVQHFCEAGLQMFFGDQLDISFLPDADQRLLDTDGPVEFAGNHVSNMDSLITATVISLAPELERFHGTTRPLMKRELIEALLVRASGISKLTTALGGIALDRKGSLADGLSPNVEALESRLLELYELGQNFAIWPEGSRRQHDGRVKELRPGVARFAKAGARHLDSTTQIVPTGLAYRRRSIFGRDKPHLRKPVFVVGQAIPVTADSEVGSIMPVLQQGMQAALDKAYERAAA